MLKIIKWFLVILLFIMLVGFLYGLFLHERRPISDPSPEADSVARVMLKAVNKSDWDSTRYVTWSLMGIHDYMWDKFNNNVEVSWNDIRVILNTKSVKGIVYKKGERLAGERSEDLVREAWAFFINDSFWLNAPVKIFNPGTVRSMVDMEDGREALMVEYTSGGVTPGDAYAWILNEKGLPRSWKMWVSVIPIGGLEIKWENWIVLSGGAKIALDHTYGPLNLKIRNLKGGNNLSDIGIKEDPFLPLIEMIELNNTND